MTSYVCQNCGKRFEAKNSRATYCSAACRKAASRARAKGPVLSLVGDDGSRKPRVKADGSRANHHAVRSHEDVPASSSNAVPSVLDAVRIRLADLDDKDWRKAACLRLAYRMDHSEMDTATALANLAAALGKQMDEVAPDSGEDDFLAAINGRVEAKRRR